MHGAAVGNRLPVSLITLQCEHWRVLPPLGEAQRAVEDAGPCGGLIQRSA